MEPIALLGIALAFGFNILTGMNDAANSIATVVATRALSPRKAIALSALANSLGPFLFVTAVAGTFATGIVEEESLSIELIFVALIAAIALVLIATLTGFPVSSSNALSGGLIGAGIASGGVSILILPDSGILLRSALLLTVSGALGAAAGAMVSRRTRLPVSTGAVAGALFGISISITAIMLSGLLCLSGILAIVLFIFVAPTLGLSIAFVLDVIISHLFRRSRIRTRRRIFQPLHLVAATIQGMSHGAHDGQHAMGIVVAILLTTGALDSFTVPLWVLAGAASAMGIGTCFGGWKVIERIARRITRIRPYQGFSAAASSALILSTLTSLGIPVSSTHVMSGAIVGVGITRGREAIQWNTVRRIVTAWLSTLPAAIFLSWAVMKAWILVIG